MSVSQLRIRPFRSEDAQQLDLFREQFHPDGRTDAPFGYARLGVETAVAEKTNGLIGGGIATKAVIIDFCKDPAAKGTDIYAAVLLLERTLTYVAQREGCVVSYVAIPSHMNEWRSIVERSGYTETFQECVVLRRMLAKETV